MSMARETQQNLTPNIAYLRPNMLSVNAADTPKWLVLSVQPLSGDNWPHYKFVARGQATWVLRGLRNYVAPVMGQIW